MRPIPPFTDTEQWIIRSTLRERYGREIPLELTEAEIRLSPDDRETIRCPSAFWQGEDRVHFVICKLGERRYRCQFYYRGFQQYGTGRLEYDDMAECVVTLLQVQADHARKRAQDVDRRGPDAEDRPRPTDPNEPTEPWLYEPVIWE
jgi:hypothetical protein